MNPSRLVSLRGIVWVGIGLFLFGLASLVYPPLRLVVSSVTTSLAALAGGIALMVLPTLVVGHELIILTAVVVGVGIWFLAHRHGQLRGMVESRTASMTARKAQATPMHNRDDNGQALRRAESARPIKQCRSPAPSPWPTIKCERQ